MPQVPAAAVRASGRGRSTKTPLSFTCKSLPLTDVISPAGETWDIEPRGRRTPPSVPPSPPAGGGDRTGSFCFVGSASCRGETLRSGRDASFAAPSPSAPPVLHDARPRGSESPTSAPRSPEDPRGPPQTPSRRRGAALKTGVPRTGPCTGDPWSVSAGLVRCRVGGHRAPGPDGPCGSRSLKLTGLAVAQESGDLAATTPSVSGPAATPEVHPVQPTGL